MESRRVRDLARSMGVGKAAGVLALAAALAGCPNQPILNGLNPVSGPPGTAVVVDGKDTFGAAVKWDANLPSEKTLPSGFLSTPFFTVPLAATQGQHPVRLFGAGQYSVNAVNFNVAAAINKPAPRVDDVTVSMFSIDSANKATMILMAHGANIDVGAKIRVDGADQETWFSRLLLNNTNMQCNTPATLGYPIYHYGTMWSAVTGQQPGAEIKVRVVNLDGQVSNELKYRIAASTDALDSDGDGLRDTWERNGYDANGDGVIDVDLPALGANYLRKDLFVEVDWMNAAAPNNAIWADIANTFANAPVLNSDGSAGITIHIDRGAGTGGGGGTIIPYADRIRYDGWSPACPTGAVCPTYANFYTIKQNNFAANRLNIYRYCLFAWDSGHNAGESGRAEGFVANDFYVTLGSWGADGQRTDFQVGTFIHELGHTLGLRHGGDTDTNRKDNYNSIMQYGNGWIIWNGQNNVFGPSQFGGIDTDCDQLDVDGVFTYSQGMRRDLDEDHLNENSGVCDNVARDWNSNGSMQNDVAFNLDDDPSRTVIEDYADWANIEINFQAPGNQWGGN